MRMNMDVFLVPNNAMTHATTLANKYIFIHGLFSALEKLSRGKRFELKYNYGANNVLQLSIWRLEKSRLKRIIIAAISSEEKYTQNGMYYYNSLEWVSLFDPGGNTLQ